MKQQQTGTLPHDISYLENIATDELNYGPLKFLRSRRRCNAKPLVGEAGGCPLHLPARHVDTAGATLREPLEFNIL